MNFYESILLYFAIGPAMAVAYRAVDRRATGPWQRVAEFVAAWLFWPLYVPRLFANRRGAAPHDDLGAAIEQVQRELDAARVGLDGEAGRALSRDAARLGELRTTLVARTEPIPEPEAVQNGERQAEGCRRSRTDLLATLAWIRELVSMIHLAKFSGAPADRVEELVAQIASAVASLSAESAALADASRRETAGLPVILQAGKEKARG